MIRKKHRAHRKVLHLACMEACFLHYGLFKYKYLTHIFGVHEKEGIRLVKEYVETTGAVLESGNWGVARNEAFRTEYLLDVTDPAQFLNLLYTVYNVKSLEDL